MKQAVKDGSGDDDLRLAVVRRGNRVAVDLNRPADLIYLDAAGARHLAALLLEVTREVEHALFP